jgi:hypothetical protein
MSHDRPTGDPEGRIAALEEEVSLLREQLEAGRAPGGSSSLAEPEEGEPILSAASRTKVVVSAIAVGLLVVIIAVAIFSTFSGWIGSAAPKAAQIFLGAPAEEAEAGPGGAASRGDDLRRASGRSAAPERSTEELTPLVPGL